MHIAIQSIITKAMLGSLLACLIGFWPGVSSAEGPALVTWDSLAPPVSAAGDTALELNTGELRQGFEARYDASVLALLDLEAWDGATLAQPLLGTDVVIDGYVLPLTSDGPRVTEFLLVPWVGACIHTPAPPPNQIIHVSYPDGLTLNKPFEPMRFTGVLERKTDYYPLFLVDGSRAIPAAYALGAASQSGQPGQIVAASAGNVSLLARVQIWANDLFTTSMSSLSKGGVSSGLLVALLLSFGYGALHTLGPGHGKAVVISYFVGTGGSMRRGVTMGVRIAVIHVLSAVVIVSLFDLTVRQATGAPPSDYRAVRLASYGLIILIGAFMLWNAVAAIRAHRRTASHDHTHGSHDHDHHQHHAHDHHHHDHHHSGCAACDAAAASTKGGGWLAASIGIVPCTGALLVMLFGLANDMIWPAILMVICISAGMAVAMSLIGIAALWGRQLAERRFQDNPNRMIRFDLGARLAGSLCVLSVGLILFAIAWSLPPLHSTADMGLVPGAGLSAAIEG